MRQKKWRRVILAAFAAAAALLLTACTSDSEIQESDSAKQESQAADSAGMTSDTAQDTSGAVSGNMQDASGTASGNTQDASGTASDDTQDALGTGSDDAQGDIADAWVGTYVSDSESVTVKKADEDTIAFSFAQSGISGTADIEQNQAVFKGDDYHVVVFSLNGTVLTVAVSSEEDFDASDSPLNGTYILSAD